MSDIIAGSPAPTNPTSSAQLHSAAEAAPLMTPAKRLLAALSARAAAPKILDLHLDDCEDDACQGCDPQYLAEKAGIEAAADWNRRHPIGTPVMAYPGVRGENGLTTRTRSRAWTLCQGTPVVAVEGHGGGISLTHIDVIADGGELTPPTVRRYTPSAQEMARQAAAAEHLAQVAAGLGLSPEEYAKSGGKAERRHDVLDLDADSTCPFEGACRYPYLTAGGQS
jgi:cytochrome c5